MSLSAIGRQRPRHDRISVMTVPVWIGSPAGLSASAASWQNGLAEGRQYQFLYRSADTRPERPNVFWTQPAGIGDTKRRSENGDASFAVGKIVPISVWFPCAVRIGRLPFITAAIELAVQTEE